MYCSKPKVIGPVRAICPVCRKTAYSQGGIHPQCAESRDDKVVRASFKVVPATSAKVQSKTEWTRRCPGCQREVHVRSATCDCGHRFQPKRAG